MAIITISRGTYSGGKAVAEELSQKLGYPCISKEIVIDAAEEFGVPEDKLTTAMETVPRSWLKSPDKRIAHMNYIRYALLKRAKENDLVYHGSAGHLLLGGVSHVMRIRVIADMEYRINAAMEHDGVTRKQAFSMIKKLDKQSINWTRFLYGVDWHDPALYDAVFNLDQISIKSTVEIIAKMTELEDFRPTESSKAALDNQVLNSMVWASLAKDKRTNPSNINVTSDNGVVTLSGSSGSGHAMEVIEEVTRSVEGVKDVVNDIGIGSDWQW